MMDFGDERTEKRGDSGDWQLERIFLSGIYLPPPSSRSMQITEKKNENSAPAAEIDTEQQQKINQQEEPATQNFGNKKIALPQSLFTKTNMIFYQKSSIHLHDFLNQKSSERFARYTRVLPPYLYLTFYLQEILPFFSILE